MKKLAALLCCLLPAVLAADWPKFLGPHGDGTSPERGLISPWPADGLAVLWQTALGEGYCNVAIAGGRCFPFDRIGNQLRCRALSAATGQELWERRFPCEYVDQYGYDGGPRSSPVVVRERLFLIGPDGSLRCLKATDGTTLWEKKLNEEYGVVQNFFGVGSSPWPHGEMLLVPVGGSPTGSDRTPFAELKGNGTGLVALEQATGRERWRLSNELASYASPLVVNREKLPPLGLWFARGGLVGFDPEKGQQLFHFPWRARLLESVNAANPVVHGDEVFLTESYGPGGVLLKLTDPAAPKVLWSDADKGRKQSLACHWATPILVNGNLYGCHGMSSNVAELRCVDWSTGEVKWRHRGLGRCSLLAADGHLIVLTEDGQLLLLRANPERFDLVSSWEPKAPEQGGRFLLEHPAWAAPVLADGRLFVRGKSRLLCLQACNR